MAAGGEGAAKDVTRLPESLGKAAGGPRDASAPWSLRTMGKRLRFGSSERRRAPQDLAKVAFGSSIYIPESVLDVPDNLVRGTLGLVDLAFGLEVFADADLVPVKLKVHHCNSLHARASFSAALFGVTNVANGS